MTFGGFICNFNIFKRFFNDIYCYTMKKCYFKRDFTHSKTQICLRFGGFFINRNKSEYLRQCWLSKVLFFIVKVLKLLKGGLKSQKTTNKNHENKTKCRKNGLKIHPFIKIIIIYNIEIDLAQKWHRKISRIASCRHSLFQLNPIEIIT